LIFIFVNFISPITVRHSSQCLSYSPCISFDPGFKKTLESNHIVQGGHWHVGDRNCQRAIWVSIYAIRLQCFRPLLRRWRSHSFHMMSKDSGRRITAHHHRFFRNVFLRSRMKTNLCNSVGPKRCFECAIDNSNNRRTSLGLQLAHECRLGVDGLCQGSSGTTQSLSIHRAGAVMQAREPQDYTGQVHRTPRNRP